MSRAGQDLAKTSHYLGIDFGASDVGLALADSETRIAFAHKTLKNDKDLLQKIGEIINREDVETVVIGIPSHINRFNVDYEGEKLGEIIEDNFGIEVQYQNEMFTTKMAQQNLIEKGVKGIKRYDDQEAARIILQDWLDKRKN
ncbi:MAG: hypothetical protein A3E91_02885 [Candidatus Moranbacteria bacterium RIFCSPHIGHO2_12_FULL_40_10]|nr:MAG: hypothetical protein A3E91_02885 [Candidatus Moranbacteria bacterium RIFCSPHIGHO2_12_FULL_40_10]